MDIDSITGRRRDFLRGLGPDRYLAAFNNLIRKPNPAISTYSDVFKVIRIGATLQFVCPHVLFWFDPNWRLPTKTNLNDPNAKYDWLTLFKTANMLPEAMYIDDPEQDAATDKERDRLYDVFMASLVNRVTKDLEIWKPIVAKVSS